MTSPTILLVDDDVEFLGALEKMLRKRGYKVTATAWPTDAVQKIGEGKEHFDIVISDIRMPAISGFTFIRALRESNPDIAVIVLSAFANSAVRESALNDGAIACLEKPVDMRLLFEAITRVTRKVDKPRAYGGKTKLNLIEGGCDRI